MEPIDMLALQTKLEDTFGPGRIRGVDVISAALYPSVFNDYQKTVDLYGELQ
jgi:pyruvate carboxylase